MNQFTYKINRDQERQIFLSQSWKGDNYKVSTREKSKSAIAIL